MMPKTNAPFWARTDAIAGIAILIVLGLLTYHPWLSGRVIVPYDAFDFAYPTMYFASHSFHQGEWPWWNPYVYSGYPQIADPQALTFSPLSTWLMALFNQPTPLLFDRILIGHLGLAGIGMFFLARTAGRSLPAALLAGVIAMVGGCVTARLQHPQLLIAYGFVPWVGLTLIRYLTRPNLWRSLAFGAALGLLGVHLLQNTYIALVLLAGTILAFLAYRLLAERQGIGRLIGGLSIAVVVTLLICGWQVIATLSFLPETQRAALALTASRGDSAPWSIFMTLLQPEYWHGDWGQYDGPLDQSEGTIYAGILAFPLLLIGIAQAVRFILRRGFTLPQLATLLLLVQTVFVIFYGIGLTTPAYALYYKWLPGITLFRRPVDAFYILNFYIAFFAALGFDSLRPLLAKRRFYLLTGLAAAALLALTVGSSPYFKIDDPNATLWLLLAAALLFAFGLAGVQRQRQMLPLGLALCLGIVADLRTHTLAGSPINAGAPRFAGLFPNGSPLSRLLQNAIARPGQPSARIEQNYVNYYWSNAPSVFGISSTEGYNPFVYSRYSVVFGTSQGRQTDRPFTPWATSYTSPVFNLMGASYVVSFPFSDASKTLRSSGFTPDITSDGMIAWHNPRALPRVLTPTDLAFWTGNPTADHAQAMTVDFTKTLMLEPQDKRTAAGLCTGSVAHVSLLSDRNDSSRYRVVARDGGGWFVVTDQATSGWHSYLDGQATDLYRGDLLVRAVCVPAGQHIVTFRFEPFRKMRDWILNKAAFGAKAADSDRSLQ